MEPTSNGHASGPEDGNMPRIDRAPSFQFYPGDWLSDPGVLGLNWSERGRFFWAICLSRQTDAPGDAAEDQWRRWMGYGTMQWAKARYSFLTCFFVAENGNWIQKRTASDAARQHARYLQARKGAEMTNEKRWGSGISVAQRHDSDAIPNRPASRSTVTPSSASASSRSDSERKLKFGSTLPEQKSTTSASAPESTPVARDLTTESTPNGPHPENARRTKQSIPAPAAAVLAEILPSRIPPEPEGPESFRCASCGTNALRRRDEERELCAKCWFQAQAGGAS
jgi:uncharacterized protein YdaU (DUF1376 family)